MEPSVQNQLNDTVESDEIVHDTSKAETSQDEVPAQLQSQDYQ